MAAHDVWEWQASLGDHEEYQGYEDFAAIWARLEGLDSEDLAEGDKLKVKEAGTLITALNQHLLDQDDTAAIFQATKVPALSEYKITQPDIEAVKKYDFDSDTVDFTAENYYQWRRMAEGHATVDDLRFLLHELVELRLLKGKEQEIGFDPTAHHEADKDKVDEAFAPAHLAALQAETQFLAAAVHAQGLVPQQVTWQQVALADPTRAEETMAAVLFYDQGRVLATDEEVIKAVDELPSLREEYFKPASDFDKLKVALGTLKAKPATALGTAD